MSQALLEIPQEHEEELYCESDQTLKQIVREAEEFPRTVWMPSVRTKMTLLEQSC